MNQSTANRLNPGTDTVGDSQNQPSGTVAQTGGPTALASRDGIASFVPTDPRSLSPVGRTLPNGPLTGVGTVGGGGWLMPLGAALVTALVVFAIGGLVVQGWRTQESAPVVTIAEQAPAAQAPAAGVPLSEVIKPKAAVTPVAAPDPAAASSDEPESKAADDSARSAPAVTPRAAARPATRPASAKPTAEPDAAEVTPPKSAADFLPNGL